MALCPVFSRRSHSIYICQEFGPSRALSLSLSPSSAPESAGAVYRKIIKASAAVAGRPTCEHHCSKINNRKVGCCEIYQRASHPESVHKLLLEKEQEQRLANIARRFCAPTAFLISHTRTRRESASAKEENNISCVCFAAAGIALSFLNAVDASVCCFVFIMSGINIQGAIENFNKGYSYLITLVKFLLRKKDGPPGFALSRGSSSHILQAETVFGLHNLFWNSPLKRSQTNRRAAFAEHIEVE